MLNPYPSIFPVIGAALIAFAAPATAHPDATHAEAPDATETEPQAETAAETPPETPEEARARLNQEQLEAVKAQFRANQASLKAHEEAIQKQKEYEEALAKWKADVAACQAAGTCAR